MTTKQMNENDVVNAVCQRMERIGYKILSYCDTNTKGIDVHAHDQINDHHYYVEAKGGTSSKKETARFGRPFSKPQVFDRVAKGIFTCLELRAKYPDRMTQHIELAVPESSYFRSYINPIIAQLKEAGIDVYFYCLEPQL